MRLHVLESERPQQVHHGPDTVPADSPGGVVWQTQQPMLIADFEQETRFPAMAPVWRDFGMRSGYYLPLTTAQRRLGTIHFASAAPRRYDPADLELFQQVARLAAVAVDNALNFEKAECYQRKLAESAIGCACSWRSTTPSSPTWNCASYSSASAPACVASCRWTTPAWLSTTRAAALFASTPSTSPAARGCSRRSWSSPSTIRRRAWP